MRAFEPVVAAIETATGPVEISGPGCAPWPRGGPVRRVGEEAALAGTMRAAVADALPSGGRVGIADGCFAARLAAIEQTVPPGGTRAFLAPLPVTVLSPPDLVAILQRPGCTDWVTWPLCRPATVVHGTLITVGGAPTANVPPRTGGTFVNLEDETGLINVVCVPKVWSRVARTSPALTVRGRLERIDGSHQRHRHRPAALRPVAARPFP